MTPEYTHRCALSTRVYTHTQTARLYVSGGRVKTTSWGMKGRLYIYTLYARPGWVYMYATSRRITFYRCVPVEDMRKYL